MNKITLLCCRLIPTLVFTLLTSVSFSQNANLIISGNGVDISNNDITPSLTDNTDFGTVGIGYTLDNTFVLRNTGTGGSNPSRRITFSNPSLVISGPDAGEFSIVSGPASGNTLNGSGAVFSPNLVVRFTPAFPVAVKNATLTVRYTNNGGELIYTYDIRGTSIATPEIDIQGNATTITDGDLTPSVTDWTEFGTTSIGIGLPRTFTIKNTGAITLNIGVITFSGVDAGEFSVTVPPSSTVAPGGSTLLEVTFTPTSNGIKTADISIINDDSNENPYNFSIRGIAMQVFFDSDGDGIFDNVDIDDDNDGIRDINEEAYCNSANGHKVNYKFLNETFGTGPKTTINTTYDASTTYCYEDGIVGPNTAACPFQSSWILDDGEYCVVSKITGVVASDPENIHGDLAWYNGEDHTPSDTNGRMAVFNASFTPGIFYETTITGVLSNLPITYSFWALNIMAQSTYPGSILPNITVEFYDMSNNLLSSFNTGDIGRCSGGVGDNSCTMGEWKQFSTSVNLGNVNTFTIRFKNNAPGGGGNDLALDDILITQTLCDLDNDGVADLFDLDADNDGIEDIIEADFGNLSNGKGRMDVAWIDANANGMHDSAESALIVLDSDGDGIPNYIDLDSDNDSVFDVDESGAGNIHAAIGYVNGDGDINGDGVGDGLDSETFREKDSNGDGIVEGFGDGILDIYDYDINAYGNLDQGSIIPPFLNYLLDTDGDGIPDYIDAKSNGVDFDISKTLYASLDSDFDGIIDSTTDIDGDGIMDSFDTNTAYFGSPRDLDRKLLLDFDGRNDYGQSTAILGGLNNASLMAWINLNSAFSTDGIVIGQDKFQLRITSAKKVEAVVNGTTLTYGIALNVSQWHHVATVYGGGFLKLYLNGELVATQATTGNIAADASLLTLGKSPIADTKYFKGKIDEVRVFNVSLTDSQLQRMVYQEIQDNSSQVRGTVIPKDVGTLPFANLLRYYRMDAYKDDIIDNLTTPGIDISGTKIYNHKNIYVQQAPMPFITERTGDFATAANSPTKEIRGLDIMDYDWSIVNVKHNITESFNNIDLGMIIDPAVNIVMDNDNKIQNDWYLKLDGKIDLQGKSQLVQTVNSDLDDTSIGSIERDQQGQSNKFNYNYWSSPVCPIGSANNSTFTVNGVFKDGTTATPQNINWVGGYNGSPTSPISLASYWIFKFQNVSGIYANWTAVGPNGSLSPAQGFTLKGSGAVSVYQNYTFTGKPFNGDITSPIAANNLNLSGNPYASAIDANQFIDDNVASLGGVSSTTGTIYFWEHSSSNDTHNLAEYQGGYAAYTKVGGTPPVAPSEISGLGGNTKIAQRFIPVGQGFFVVGSATGGNIIFNNTQRLFVKEDNPSSFQLFRATNNNLLNANRTSNNENDTFQTDTISKIRLGFNSSNNYHCQILLGFMGRKATNEIDPGYDGVHIGNQPNDMYFMVNDTKLTIQGVGKFNENKKHKLEVKTAVEGKVQFVVDSLENFDSNQTVFIYDKYTNRYHDISNVKFEIHLPAGIFSDRFYLCFKSKKNHNHNKNILDDEDIQVIFTNKNKVLNITNLTQDNTISAVSLYNILGQFILKWDTNDKEQTSIQIPIQDLNSGTYIAKVKTSKGVITKKIIIK